MSGNNVSHAMNKTKRKFYPNLHTKKFFVPETGETVILKVSANALRTINKKGISSPLFSDIDINDYFYFSHEDVVSELPESAVELANNDMGVQSFSIKNQIFGVQFHPEFTSDITQEYVNIRYKRGIVNNCNQVFESKTSYKIILNFIRLLRVSK